MDSCISLEREALIADALSFACRAPQCLGTMRLAALRDPPHRGGRWECSACGAVVLVTSSGTVVLGVDSPILEWALPHCIRCADRLEAAISS